MLDRYVRSRGDVPRRRWALAIAAAVSAWAIQSPAAQTTYTWVGGNSGDPNNFNDAANWTPTGGPPGTTSANDIALFNTAAANQPQVTGNDSLGELDFATSGWSLSSSSTSNVLTLNSSTSGGGGIGIVSAATTGTNDISVNLDIAAVQMWEVANGGTLQIDGVISDSQALTIGATGFAGTTILTNSNSYGGSITLGAGTLELAGATVNSTAQFGTLQSVGTITLNSGSTLLINNTTAAGGNANNRLNSGMSLQLWGGSFVYDGADAAGTSSSGSISSTTLNAGPVSLVTVTANSGNGATFNLGSLGRNTGGGVLFVNGTNLGTTGGQVLVNSQPQLVGTTSGSATIQAGVDNTQIVPFMVGESGTAAGAGGTATGTANTFVTVYQPASGGNAFRPLNPTQEFTNNSIVSGNNTYITSNTTSSSTNTINSMVINKGNLTIADGTTLTDASGALLFVTSNSIQPSSSTGTLDFSDNEGVITVDSGVTANISAPITTASNGVTVNGAGVLSLTTAHSNVSGSLSLNGTVQFGNGTSSSADAMITNTGTTVNIDQSGVLNFDDVGAQTASFPIQFFNNNLTEGATYGIGTILISGPGALTLNNSFSAQYPGTAYIESQTLAPVSFTGSFNSSNGNLNSLRLYEGGTNQAGTVIGSNSTPVTWNVTGGGSIGNSNTSATTSLYVSNNNFGTGVTPSPVVFNLTNTGQINLAGNMYIGYNGGAITANINGPITLSQVSGGAGALFGAYNPGNTNNNSTDYNVINVGAGGSINAYSAYLAYSQGQFQYLGVTTGGQFSINNASQSSAAYAFYGANLGDSLVEVGTINGSAGAGSAINFGTNTTNTAPPAIVFNGGTTSSGAHTTNQFSELNIFAGGSLNISNPNNGSGAGSGASGGTGGLNAGYAAGQTFVLNVYGGSLNDFGGNEPVYVDAGIPNSAAGAGFTAYSIVNVDSDANGNVGKLITAYLRALPNPTNGSATANGSTSAFLNFNGGEVEYNNLASTGLSPGPGNGLPNNGWVGGVFVFPKGAIMGTNALDSFGTAPPTGASNLDHPLMAPLGNGVTTIPVTNGGSGYLNPPMVQITDSTGIDASAVATLSNGVVTAITITSPGINYTAPTITLIGGDPTAAATIGTATVAANVNTGGFTKVDNGALIAQGGYWYPTPGQSPATQADLQAAQNTYGGPTTVVAGTLELNGVYNETNNVIIETNTSANAATLQINQPTTLNGITSTTSPAWIQVNNNLPLAAAIIVGDVPANTVINGTTLTNPGTFQITATGKAGVSGFALAANQVLSGFGNVTGTSTYGLNIGQSPSGTVAGAITSNAMPNPATPTALTGTDSVIAPGYSSSGSALVQLNNTSTYNPSSSYGPIVVGTSGQGTSTVTFNTKQGNATSLSAPTATGALTLGNGTSMTTSLGGAGTYYWKLDLSNGGAGATTTPGTATNSPGLSGGIAAGAGWDELIMDAVTVNSTVGTTASGTTNAFTVQATSFTSGTTVSGGSAVSTSGSTMGATSYSWVIARVNQAYSATTAQGLLASLSLDTTGLPKPAGGYEYFLSTQPDPAASDTDLVVNYAPVPEPTTMLLLGPAVGALMLRRRRRRA